LISLGAHFSEQHPTPKLNQKSDSSSNFYMRNAILKTYDKNGAWLQNLTAKNFVHLQNKGETYLTEPALSLANNEEDFFWKIRAKKGKIKSNADGKRELVEFWDTVTATKLNMEGEFTSLNTEKMVVYPARNYLETSSLVFIDNEIGRTSSVGLQAFLNDDSYKFFSSDETRVSTILLQ